MSESVRNNKQNKRTPFTNLKKGTPKEDKKKDNKPNVENKSTFREDKKHHHLKQGNNKQTPKKEVLVIANKQKESTFYTEYGYAKWGFSFLEEFCKNLNETLRPKMDDYEVYGRDTEVKEVYTTLRKEIKNTPCLVGEAGTGKSAIVEGIVVQILKGEAPEQSKLNNKTIWELELSSITGKKRLPNGEIMETVGIARCIFEELAHTKDRNVIFIDEVHQIIGAGSTGVGMQDIAETAKPALARGLVNMICATTPDEYRRSIEKNKALNRRITQIICREPSITNATYMINKIKKRFERNQGVKVPNDVVRTAVELSARYIPEFFLPDKAIDLIDTAVARVAVDGKDTVTVRDIAEILSARKNIPVDIIVRIGNKNKINYRKELSKRVKGQEYAIAKVARAMARSKQRLNDETSCRSSLLFVGTTGTGKTELAKALAEIEFGDENEMIRIDCSEYNVDNALPRLIGTDDEDSEGVLTGKVKRKPYCVLLFDELDKSPIIWDLFLQILDDGHLSTGKGEMISFKEAIIIGTTNEGAGSIKEQNGLKTGGIRCMNKTDYDGMVEIIKSVLGSRFRPEFLNRWDDIIVFNMLDKEVIVDIVHLVAENMRKFFYKNHIELVVANKTEYFDYLVRNGTDVEMGARPLKRLYKDEITDEIAEQLELCGRTDEWYRVILQETGEAPKRFENGKREHFDRRVLEVIPIKCNHKPEWKDELEEVGRVDVVRDEETGEVLSVSYARDEVRVKYKDENSITRRRKSYV